MSTFNYVKEVTKLRSKFSEMAAEFRGYISSPEALRARTSWPSPFLSRMTDKRRPRLAKSILDAVSSSNGHVEIQAAHS